MNKYHAMPTWIDGIRFASKREAERYQELKLLESQGEIRYLETQKPIVLHGPEDKEIGKFIADFVYWSGDRYVIEDAKGFRTQLYKWKKKHVKAEYGIEIQEV